MTAAADRGRRRALAAVTALVAAAIAPPLAAQDPRSGSVQSAARAWLALIDREDGAASWEAAGAKFKSAADPDAWTPALKAVRGPLGAVETRSVQSTRFSTALPGFPAGEYAVVVFRTSFANKAAAQETVTLEREGETWRVVGYAIA